MFAEEMKFSQNQVFQSTGNEAVATTIMLFYQFNLINYYTRMHGNL